MEAEMPIQRTRRRPSVIDDLPYNFKVVLSLLLLFFAATPVFIYVRVFGLEFQNEPIQILALLPLLVLQAAIVAVCVFVGTTLLLSPLK